MRISDWSSDVCSSDLHLLEGLSALAHDVAEILDRQPVRKQGRIEGHVLGVLREGRRRVEDSTRSPYRGAHVLADVRCSRSGVVALVENDDRILVDQIGRASCRERVCQYV